MTRSLIPELHPDFAYKAYNVGREKTPLLVIDNYLKDAQGLVDYCKGMNNFGHVDTYYPGVRMLAPQLYMHALHHHLARFFFTIFGLSPEYIEGGKAYYSMIVTPPEKLEPKQCIPHIDSFISGNLACVHYLCDKSKGGTSLYRHKKTGFEVVTKETIDSYNQAVIDEGALTLEKSYMNGTNDYFERIAKIDAQFNRVVIYPGNILHSGDIAPEFNFDTDPTRGRLTLNSFIFKKQS
jgi:hypothetical protein